MCVVFPGMPSPPIQLVSLDLKEILMGLAQVFKISNGFRMGQKSECMNIDAPQKDVIRVNRFHCFPIVQNLYEIFIFGRRTRWHTGSNLE